MPGGYNRVRWKNTFPITIMLLIKIIIIPFIYQTEAGSNPARLKGRELRSCFICER